MLGTGYQIIVSIIAFGLLIFVHELGHFLLAKYFGVGVLEFAIGFGKKVWQKRIGETRYSIGLIPLGGYVRMVGDDLGAYEGSSASDESGPNNSNKSFSIEPIVEDDLDELDQALLEDKSRWFLEKGFWPKFLIVFAGPAFNILFAWLLSFSLIMSFGAPEVSEAPMIGEVTKDGPAAKAGLQAGDEILKINQIGIESWDQIVSTVLDSGGEELEMQVRRADEAGETSELDFVVVGDPVPHELALVMGLEDGKHMIGIQRSYQFKPASILKALKLSAIEIYRTSVLTVKSVGWLISGQVSVKHVGGPISIIKHTASSASAGIDALFGILIFLSVSLAVLNLLPIPVLDGGHIVFFIIEAIARRPVHLRVRELAHQVGMLIILSLMIFAIGNDLVNLFFS